MLVHEQPQTAIDIRIIGIVQGVGFRPFVFKLANRYHVKGWIRNTSSGVEIAAEGSAQALEDFLQALKTEAPPMAVIDKIETCGMETNGFHDFQIKPSKPTAGDFQPISPDAWVCEDCLAELYHPGDRRYRYPFINCTNCGPRFTIIQDIPYDRPLTTMAPFKMCEACAAEYRDPADRRYHAQPVACPDCGPHLWFERSGKVLGKHEDALQATRAELQSGAIIAIKGLGGFHLACDATNAEAVARLRARKQREAKPLAVMMADRSSVEKYCLVSAEEGRLLESRERPIVLLRRAPLSEAGRSDPLPEGISPGQETIGVMLPYTPLHHLLLEPAPDFPSALVMTSGNRRDEPIAFSNEEARKHLTDVADSFLMHNREIHTRCDDSVTRIFSRVSYPIRRARGYAPMPMHVEFAMPPMLATGAELKNTFCLSRGPYAFLSHHIGNLDNHETLAAFEEAIRLYEELFRIKPELVVHDLHPDYLSTGYALARAASQGLKSVGIQHHHAHIAACMGENGIERREPVIGAALDGTGFGEDGTVWGGEFLVADYRTFERLFFISPVPMPGGEAAIREPWRMAVAWLKHSGIEDMSDLPPARFAGSAAISVVQKALAAQINTPDTSSMGRLFDAVASLIGIRHRITYEAQAAVELEALVDPAVNSAYPFELSNRHIDLTSVWHGLVADWRAGAPVQELSAMFHNTMANLVLAICQRIRGSTGIRKVALSGGVWLNMALLHGTLKLLQQNDFVVLTHRKIPANDGGLAFGQALIAAERQK